MDKLAMLVNRMEQLEELLQDDYYVFLEWAKHNQIPLDGDLEHAVFKFLHEFIGCFKTKQEMVQEILHEWYPDNPLIPYVDEEFFARELRHDTYMLEVDNRIALFYNS